MEHTKKSNNQPNLPKLCRNSSTWNALGIRNDPRNSYHQTNTREIIFYLGTEIRTDLSNMDERSNLCLFWGTWCQHIYVATREIGWKPRFPHHIWDPSISSNKLNHLSGPSVNFSPQSVRHAHEVLCLCNQKGTATQYQTKTFRYVPVHCSPALTTKPFFETFNQSMFDVFNFSASQPSRPKWFAR